MEKTIKRLQHKQRCEVNSCYNNRKNNQTSMIHSFFRIPQSNRQEARQKWLSIINVTEEYLTSTKKKDHYVCDRHFCSNDYGLLNLRRIAVPSLCLNEFCPDLLSTNINKNASPSIYDCTDEIKIEKEDTIDSIVNSFPSFDSDMKIRLLNEMKIESKSCNDFSNNSLSTAMPLVLVYSSAEVQTDEKYFIEKVSSQCCIKTAENEIMYQQRIGFLQKDFQMKIERKTKEVQALKLRVKNLKLQFKYQKNNNVNLKRKSLRDKKKIKKLIEFKKKDILERVDELTYLNTNEKSFCKLLLKNKLFYTPSDQFIVKTIHDRSPLLYRYLRDTLNIKFPCLKTIKSWGYTSFENLDINNEVVE